MKAPAEALVHSADCTHILPDEGLVLEGGKDTPIPTKHLARALALPGVTEVTPHNPDPTTEV